MTHTAIDMEAAAEIARRIDVARAQGRRADLTPKQLEWCREHLPHFANAQDQALAARAAMDAAREEE